MGKKGDGAQSQSQSQGKAQGKGSSAKGGEKGSSASGKGASDGKGAASKAKDAVKPKDQAKTKDSKDKEPEKPKESPEEEALRKLKEEGQQKFNDDEKEEKARVELRDANRKVAKEGRAPLDAKKRDKSIVKVQRFQNKLKLFKGEADIASIRSDVDGVDASKYVSELADCLLEAASTTLKLKELRSGVVVCSMLGQTYEEFPSLLAKGVEKAFQATPQTEVNRRRFLLRFCAELTLCEAIPPSQSPIVTLVSELTDSSLSEELLLVNFTILASFVQKLSVSCLNIVPAKQAQYEEALGVKWPERQCLLEDSIRTRLAQVIVHLYQQAAGGLLRSTHNALVEQEQENAKLRIAKGSVDADNQAKHETLKDSYEKIQGHLKTMSESLNQPLPTTQEEDTGATRIMEARKEEEKPSEDAEPISIWEDAEQQRFFEEIVDLKDVVPAVLLGISKGSEEEKKEKEEAKAAKKLEDEVKKAEEDLKGGAGASEFELYLARISKAEQAKAVDDLVVEFFHEFNTRGNRRLLAQHLLQVRRTNLHLLPPHSRFIATIAPILKDIPNYVLTQLQHEYTELLANKDPEKIESKIRNIRYLSELCKFKICPQGVILDALKAFCDDFSQHNAELCAHLLQVCGRFLLYTPETAMRTENLLERMQRLKNAKGLNVRLEVMLEDAYYHCKPPEGKKNKNKAKPDLEQFVRHLIFDILYEDEDEDRVLKLVRKLPWDKEPASSDDPEKPRQKIDAPLILKKCILDLNMHANYENMFQLASLLSGLAKYRDYFVIDCIDQLLENIQIALERNDFREMPLRVRHMKFLGELYNYRLVDSNLIFDTLYHTIGFGGPTAHRAGQTATAHRILERLAAERHNLGSIAEGDESNTAASTSIPQIFADPMHPIEPAWDNFRTKLVCVLLDTCGHYFDRGAVKQKLDRFLTFFLRYVRSKDSLPMRMEHLVNDIMERLRPKMKVPGNLQEATEALSKLLKNERENLKEEIFNDDVKDDEDDDAKLDKEGAEESEDDSSSSDSGSDGESSESESSDDDSSDDEVQRQNDADYDRGEEVHHKREEEEDEFDKEFQQMLIDSLEVSKAAPRAAMGELPTAPPPSKRNDSEDGPGVFSLMQRRGGAGAKNVMKPIWIPEDSKLAQVSMHEEVQSSKEKEEMKKFVLQYEQNASDILGGVHGDYQKGGYQKGYQKGAYQKGGKGKGYPQQYRGQRGDSQYVRGEFLPTEQPQPALLAQPQIRQGKGGTTATFRIAGGGGSRGTPATRPQGGF